MGRVIAFSEFKQYYERAKKKPDVAHGAIFDANILISLTYEVGRLHEEVREFFDQTLAHNFSIFIVG
ncbi:MAG: hypothetical protein A2Z20_06420 [Bdellovibrionales bacterium RBG_16_40_8]|nr:MAG: hypothetical protein A2Z20_06420 [Bdellovibrionales bacterium RBG_16_40_8]